MQRRSQPTDTKEKMVSEIQEIIATYGDARGTVRVNFAIDALSIRMGIPAERITTLVEQLVAEKKIFMQFEASDRIYLSLRAHVSEGEALLVEQERRDAGEASGPMGKVVQMPFQMPSATEEIASARRDSPARPRRSKKMVGPMSQTEAAVAIHILKYLAARGGLEPEESRDMHAAIAPQLQKRMDFHGFDLIIMNLQVKGYLTKVRPYVFRLSSFDLKREILSNPGKVKYELANTERFEDRGKNRAPE